MIRALVPALCCAWLAVTTAGCSHTPQNPAATPSAAQTTASPASRPTAAGVPIEIRSQKAGTHYITLTVQKRNQKKYVLRADSETGRYFGQDTGVSTFVNPHITFFGSGNQRLVADAPAGTVVEKDKTVRMSGGVHARTQNGMTLTSDTLRYDDDTEIAHGEGNVVVTSPQGEELRGETLDWNLRNGRIDVDHAR